LIAYGCSVTLSNSAVQAIVSADVADFDETSWKDAFLEVLFGEESGFLSDIIPLFLVKFGEKLGVFG
jgi:hypothetical protein